MQHECGLTASSSLMLRRRERHCQVLSTFDGEYWGSECTGLQVKPKEPDIWVAMPAGHGRGQVTCSTCMSSHTITRVALPFVLKYLVTELAAMNIKCTFDLR